MNIGNMPDDELDDLFRLSASEVQPEFDPAAWQAMEKKLDAGKVRPGFWFRLAWLTGLFLIMGLGFWISLWWLPVPEHGGELPSTQTSASPARRALPPADRKSLPRVLPGQSSQPETGQASSRPQTETSPSATAAGPAATPGSPVATRAGNTLAPVTSREPGKAPKALLGLLPRRENRRKTNRNENSQPANPATQQVPVRVTAVPEPIGGETKILAKVSAGPENKAAANPENKSAAAESTTTDVPAAGLVPAPADSALVQKKKIEKEAPVPVLLPADSTGTAKKMAAAPDSTQKSRKLHLGLQRLTFTLMAAPDLSSVGFSNPGGISTNAGAAISYRLGDRWQVITGLIKARKVYGAKAEDYGKKDFWKNRYKPSDIEAVCRVLDIPLNLGYRVMSREKSSLAVVMGVSSYLMLSETYEYYYYTGPTKTWKAPNPGRHLFSMYNLSAQYSWQLLPGMRAGVEPFIKVPLAGVGAGKVKLASAGTFFSLSYQVK